MLIIFCQPQVEQDGEIGAENADTSLFIDDTDEDTAVENVVKSTKKPTQIGKQSKRLKLENSDNELLEKAVKCLDHVTATPANFADGADLFGQYVASELRMLDPRSQAWVKLQIQQILFNVSSQLDGSGQFASAMDRFYSPSPFPSSSSSTSTSPHPGIHFN